jgi:hypothetical protein
MVGSTVLSSVGDRDVVCVMTCILAVATCMYIGLMLC